MMKIYSIRDRMMDYFMQPFIGPDDKPVIAGVAEQINGDGIHAINRTPHYFEIWRLGEINEEGEVTAAKELIAECGSLVRGSVREQPAPGDRTLPQAPGSQQGAPSGSTGKTDADPGSA